MKSVDDVFISPRNGQPYVVRYGIRGTQFTESGMPIVAHEKTGVDGRHLTVTLMGEVKEVDEARLHELIAAPTTPTSNAGFNPFDRSDAALGQPRRTTMRGQGNPRHYFMLGIAKTRFPDANCTS